MSVVPLRKPGAEAEPEGPHTFEVIGRYGNVIATTDTEDSARQDAWYRTHKLGMTGVTVERVQRIERRTVIYRPRKPEPAAKPTAAEIELLLEAAQLETQP